MRMPTDHRKLIQMIIVKEASFWDYQNLFLDPVSETLPGPRNLITDVPGVSVGQTTIQDGVHNTGVTVIKPAPDNVFLNKLTAATHVINGFGKSTGLVQINELGT